eukprot:TRINITY_DN2794_c0_g1_i8.p1 TRINITY_DN2794_c0_g1~~TRINITY_DN2794_c0_g1_i8.p1  ORF type:complete len:321 (-),score=59.06 TRINITY_DN2794_c0_g1_i8:601-1563(-)
MKEAVVSTQSTGNEITPQRMTLQFLLFSLSIYFSWGDVGQIHISYTGKTNEMLLMWVSDSTNDPSLARYGLSPAHLSNQAKGTVDSYTNDQGYTSGGIHQVLLQDLSPSTTYFYQVGGNVWSSIYNFTSAPKEGTNDIVFGVIGDVGADANSEETFRGLVKMRSTQGLDVVIHAGDLSYANDYDYGGPIWDKYGGLLTPLASSTPYNPSVGNHEKQDKFLAFKYRYATNVLENHTNGGKDGGSGLGGIWLSCGTFREYEETCHPSLTFNSSNLHERDGRRCTKQSSWYTSHIPPPTYTTMDFDAFQVIFTGVSTTVSSTQ